MRKFLFPLMAFAIITGCDEKNTSENRIPILLNSGVTDLTKTPVENNSSATVRVEGWESNAAADYTAASTWQSSAVVKVQDTPAAITLDPVQYYHASSDYDTYIMGWHPVVDAVGGVLAFDGDATEDIMVSNVVSGNKDEQIGDALVFRHLTSQLRFLVKRDATADGGLVIKSIVLKGATAPLTVGIPDGNIISSQSFPAGLNVPGIAEAEILADARQAGDAVLITPVENNTAVTLDITVGLPEGGDYVYENIAFTTADGALSAGTAYDITMTFKQKEIVLTANIVPWNESDGSVDIY